MEAHKKRKLMSPLEISLTKAKMDMVTVGDKPTIPPTDIASTSTGTPIGTVTVGASAAETKAAIAALLTLGSDLPQPEDDLTAENASLVPIDPTKHKTSDDPAPLTSILTNTNPSTGNKGVKPTSPVPVHKRFVTVEYKLKCKQ